MFLASNSTTIPFITKPNDIEYVSCGNNLNLKWSYDDSSRQLDKIAWYLSDIAGSLQENIANLDTNFTFAVSPVSMFQPALQTRLEFLPNAGLRIKNIKAEDEAFILIELDFIDLDSSRGLTQVKVYRKLLPSTPV